MTQTHTTTAHILVVDDHPEMAEGLGDYLRDHGYTVDTATSGAEAIEIFSRTAFDAVISDLKMKNMDGLELIDAIHAVDSKTPILIMTAYGSIENAIEAIRRGAFHYFSKPLKTEEVRIYLQRAIDHRRMEVSHAQLLRDIQERYTFESMIGRSTVMRRIFDLIDRVTDSPVCVLITGESGTGKELIARAIHFRGVRRERPFVPINCAALPAPLIESEIFGHEAGAFTGANKPRAGLAVEASGGTLFLDEISELPLELQPKLLRLLQEGEIRPVGSDKTRQVDIRILAATNANLDAAVKAGRFRADLFYRLNVVPVLVPPLRERAEDVPILAERLLQRAVSQNPMLSAKRLSAEGVEFLLGHDWPGNVRELENAMERAATLCTNDIICPCDLAFLSPPSGAAPLASLTESMPTLRELESRYINHVLANVNGSKIRAAAILGVDPSTLYRRGR
ncbi:MAG: sigma-54-dependent Fis family transcriptional regulator [Deltaproteobacteria bacterium RIFOXYA12_FULL_58_15]|nr:MAG: sigma-54-dependent Fis family transcriptional regulator [Deltaproteobacteria bacterium RIFOXYA12_FULL_58_15]OGR12609.1 MAG: sigma-54-dependent Fis family transcriptional regulator [Deltaproteobacteria bacterium RIFOXYB12_FULL_58_9]